MMSPTSVTYFAILVDRAIMLTLYIMDGLRSVVNTPKNEDRLQLVQLERISMYC